MKTINKIKKELNCNIKKYSFFNNIKYIETDKGNFIIKNKFDSKIYNNLDRNNIDNYIKYKYEIDDYYIYPYLNEIEVDENEKALDIIHIISKLHNNTSYTKEISLEEIKDIYINKKNKVKELREYYDYLRFIIEEKKFPSPSELYYLKNMSIIFIVLDEIEQYLDEWYQIIKKEEKVRMSLIHNNLELSHILESSKPYLISWDKSEYNLPIYDFILFYKKEFNNLNFSDLLTIYKNNTNIKKEELLMLYIEILMPDKIILDNTEIKNIYDLTYQNLYLKKTYYLVSKDNKK